MFLSCSGEWLHDARYFHLVLPSNRETAHVCAGYASSWPAWKRAYHDLPTAVYTVVRGWKARTNILKLWDYHPQCHWEEMVSMLVRIARALQPIAARGFTHWRLSRYIDGFLGRVKCSPGPISKPIDFTRQNPIGHMASLAKKSIAYTIRSYPSANLWNPKLKAGVTEVHWSVEIQQPTPPLSDSPAVQINGATALLLQADMGWDKWLQSWSLCVAAAEPPWNSLHSIWCPSPLPALHMFLLKDLVVLEPNSSKFKTQCNLWKWKELSVSHKFSEASRLNTLFCCRLTWAEINGFRAGRCGGRRASMKFSSFHMMSISTSCSSHASFERSSHTWTKFIQIQNAVQPIKMERIVGLTQVFLKRRDWTASVGCKADTGWDKWLQSWSLWRPPSLHEILFIPYDVHLHFLLFTCFFWKI